MAVWIRVSVVVVALFFEGGMPTVQTLAHDILTSENGLFFVAAYAAAGAVSRSWCSPPACVVAHAAGARDHGHAHRHDHQLQRRAAEFPAMLLWAAIIVVLTAIGFATFYLG